MKKVWYIGIHECLFMVPTSIRGVLVLRDSSPIGMAMRNATPSPRGAFIQNPSTGLPEDEVVDDMHSQASPAAAAPGGQGGIAELTPVEAAGRVASHDRQGFAPGAAVSSFPMGADGAAGFLMASKEGER